MIFRVALAVSALVLSCAEATPSPGTSGELLDDADDVDEPLPDLDDSSDDESESDDGSEATDVDSGSLFFIESTDTPGCECDPFAQDCPEGEKCVPYASTGETFNANKCVPVTGTAEPGDACTHDGDVVATDDCDAQSVCWNGTCAPFCDGTADDPVCSEGSWCLIGYEGSVNLCLPTVR
jgi:hypothetical protein